MFFALPSIWIMTPPEYQVLQFNARCFFERVSLRAAHSSDVMPNHFLGGCENHITLILEPFMSSTNTHFLSGKKLLPRIKTLQRDVYMRLKLHHLQKSGFSEDSLNLDWKIHFQPFFKKKNNLFFKLRQGLSQKYKLIVQTLHLSIWRNSGGHVHLSLLSWFKWPKPF